MQSTPASSVPKDERVLAQQVPYVTTRNLSFNFTLTDLQLFS